MTPAEAKRLKDAEHYIASEKSDPFCAARVLTHMRNGIAGFTSNGMDAFYYAETSLEERETPNGEKYSVTVYRNRRRP